MLEVLFISMAILLAIGFPMVVPLIAGPIIVFFVFFPELNKMIIAQQMISGVKPVALVAIPLFMFAANVVTAGRSGDKLINFVMAFVGHIRGGLAISTSCASALFGSISGSTQATVCAIGSIMRPKLLENGYSGSFSTALIISASDIAFLIPPSIGFIVYGVIADTSIGQLFIAGVGPGLLITLLFSIWCYFYARHYNIPVTKKANWRERGRSTKSAAFSFGYPVIIMGGIYSGICSPTEAAAVSIAYALVVEGLIYKSIRISDLSKIALSTGIVTTVVFILIGAGIAFSWSMSYAKIPQAVVAQLLGPDPSQLKILYTISITFFIAGMFVDPIVATLILVPIFHPIGLKAGIDPVLMGTVVTLQAAIASATPPFGCDIFTAIAIFKRPYWESIKSTPQFTFILIIVSVLLIHFPEIALYLRNLAYG